MKLFLIIAFALLTIALAFPHFGIVEKREDTHKPHGNSSESSSSSESNESEEGTTLESTRIHPDSASTVESVETSTIAPEEGSGEEEEILFPDLRILLP